ANITISGSVVSPANVQEGINSTRSVNTAPLLNPPPENPAADMADGPMSHTCGGDVGSSGTAATVPVMLTLTTCKPATRFCNSTESGYTYPNSVLLNSADKVTVSHSV